MGDLSTVSDRDFKWGEVLTVLGMFSLTSGMGEVWGLFSGHFAVPLECVGFLRAARQSSLEVDVAVAEVPVDPRKALSIQRRRSTLNSCMGPEAPQRLGAGPASAQGTAAGRPHVCTAAPDEVICPAGHGG